MSNSSDRPLKSLATFWSNKRPCAERSIFFMDRLEACPTCKIDSTARNKGSGLSSMPSPPPNGRSSTVLCRSDVQSRKLCMRISTAPGSRGQIHHNAPGFRLDRHANRAHKRNQQPAFHFQHSGASAVLESGHSPQRRAVTLDDFTPDQIRFEILAGLQAHAFRAGHAHFTPGQPLGVRHRIHAAKFQDQPVVVEPRRLHFPPRAFGKKEDFTQARTALRLAERDGREFPADAARAAQNGDRDPFPVRPGIRGAGTHSRISRVKRRFNFMPAAPRMVRMERAVLPCLPITLPKSLGATRNSSTVTCSPSTTCTATSSGMSTRAFAIFSINCFITPPPSTSYGNRGVWRPSPSGAILLVTFLTLNNRFRLPERPPARPSAPDCS